MDDHAVSPVIGVIMLVAITVTMSAVVFILATSFNDPNQDYEKAAAQVKSPSAGIIEIILTREGKRAPYVDTDGAFNEYTIIINGVACSNDELPDSIRGGSVIRLNAAVSGPCQDAIVPGGADHSVTMTVVGTVILSGTVDVRS